MDGGLLGACKTMLYGYFGGHANWAFLNNDSKLTYQDYVLNNLDKLVHIQTTLLGGNRKIPLLLKNK